MFGWLWLCLVEFRLVWWVGWRWWWFRFKRQSVGKTQNGGFYMWMGLFGLVWGLTLTLGCICPDQAVYLCTLGSRP